MGKLIIYTNKELASSFDSETGTKLLLGDTKWDVPETKYQLTVDSIKYEKEMYKPCELTITCTCADKTKQKASESDPTTPGTAANSLRSDANEASAKATESSTLPKNLKQLFFFEKDTSGSWKKSIMAVDVAAAKADNTPFYVAKNYYVHSFKLEKKVEESKTSYTVTLTCFSPDKRLTLNKYCEVYSAQRFGESIFQNVLMDRFKFKAEEISYDVNRLNLLKYTANKKVKELVQPYLVQYNESFYDFLCRVANRCGEFLYYRDGKICLGLPGGTLKDLSENAICTYPEVSEAGMFDIAVSPFAENYVDETEPSQDNAVYNARFTQDETLRKLTANDGESLGWEDWNLFGLAATFLAGETLPDSFSDAIEEAAETAVKIKCVGDKVKEDYNSKYVKKYVDTFGISSYEEKGFQFLNEFYYRIRKAEEEISRRKVALNFSNNLPLIDLGDAITLQDGLAAQYIVTRLEGVFSATDKVSYSAEVIPSGNYQLSTNCSVTLLPPCSVESFIREAAPQEAIVAETNDPMYMGRVRIRYVWQVPVTKSDAVISTIEEWPKDDKKGDKKEEKKEDKKEDKKEEKQEEKKDEEKVYALSPWIRMVVPFAGGEGGFMMTPAVGDHVMVNYEEHNIDCPYVEGALFHHEQKPNRGPIEITKKEHLPDSPTRVLASGNGHCIYFKDGRGVSGFWGGMFPLAGQICNLTKKLIDKEWDKDPSALAGGMTLTDSNGIYEVAMSTTNRSISINSPLGKVDISAFTGIEISAPNGDVKISGKNITLEAGNNIVLSSGNNLLEEEPDFKTGSAQWVGSLMGSFGKAMAKFFLKEHTGVDFTKLTDVKFLRSLWEVVFKPVEGSLKIQSNRNVVMTAGEGKVCVPSSLISSVGRVGKLPSVKELTAKKYADSKFNRYKSLLVTLQKTSDVFIDKTVYESYKDLLENIRTQVNTLNSLINKNYAAVVDRQVLKDWAKDSIEDIRKQFINNLINKVDIPDADQVVAKNDKANDDEKRLREKANRGFKGLADRYKKLQGDFTALLTNTADGTKLLEKLTAISDPLKKLTPKDKEELKFELPEANAFAADFTGYDFSKKETWENPADEANWPIALTKRKIAVKLIMQVITSSEAFKTGQFSEDVVVADELKWKDYVASIKVKKDDKEEMSGFKKFGIEFVNAFAGDFVSYDEDKGWKGPAGVQKLINWDGCAGPRALWDVSQGGNILLSNSKSFTYKLNEDSKGWTPMVNPSFMALRDYLENLFSGSAFVAIE